MYLVITDGAIHYFLSSSRDAVKILREQNTAKTVWVYDRNGWWLSYAKRTPSGSVSRAKMFPDGAPREYYIRIYKLLLYLRKNNENCEIPKQTDVNGLLDLYGY